MGTGGGRRGSGDRSGEEVAAAQRHFRNAGLAKELESERNVGENFGRHKEDVGGRGGGRRKASGIQMPQPVGPC